MAVGAALMYIFDPKQGKQRRQAVRDCIHTCVETTEDAWCSTSERVNDISRNVTDRAQSLADRAQSLLPSTKKNGAWNRVLTGAAGGALAAYAMKKRGFVGATAGTVGLNLMARGLKADKRAHRWIH